MAKLSRDIDLEIGITARERRMALPCFPWHGFDFGLWADTSLTRSPSLTYTHIHTHFLAGRGVWRCTYSQSDTQTHSAAGNIDFLFGITKHWVAQLRGSGQSARKQTLGILSTFLLLDTPAWHFVDKHRKSAKNSWSQQHLHNSISTSLICFCTCFLQSIIVFPSTSLSSVSIFLSSFRFHQCVVVFSCFTQWCWMLGWFSTMLNRLTGKHILSATWIHNHNMDKTSNFQRE